MSKATPWASEAYRALEEMAKSDTEESTMSGWKLKERPAILALEEVIGKAQRDAQRRIHRYYKDRAEAGLMALEE